MPLTNEKMEEDAAPDAPCGPASPSTTILIVEDDLEVLHTTARLLMDLDYEVLEAPDGPAAKMILAEGADTIDLVFSDVVMPKGMSGIELAEWVRVEHKHIKVLLTSGYPDVARDVFPERTGIKLLAKPYKRVELAKAIEDTLAI